MDNRKKIWIVGVSMGYGHERALAPLRDLTTAENFIAANDYPNIPAADRRIWRRTENIYNFGSRLPQWGPVGRTIYGFFDRIQKVAEVYPRQARVPPTWQLRRINTRIEKGWGRHLVEKMLSAPAPLLTSYFVVAQMANYWGYAEPIYLLVTDTDVSRAWEPLDPAANITYLAPTRRAAERLQSYGVPAQKISLTGFPLPPALVSGARERLAARLKTLDPQSNYANIAGSLIRQAIGRAPARRKEEQIKLVFAVGGAGGQMDVLAEMLDGFAKLGRSPKMTLRILAGPDGTTPARILRLLARRGFDKLPQVQFPQPSGRAEYFTECVETLAAADVLFTKPSELSFYGALGLPLLLTSPLGSHEARNREWLLDLGAGKDAPPLRYLAEWLPELLESGRLAEMALQGYLKIERVGTAKVAQVIAGAG